MESLYRTTEWLDLADRAKARDGHRCSVARLLGGLCSSTLHAHHLIPVSEGGDPLPDLDGVITVCSRHHPTLEALRRYVLRRGLAPTVRPCRHHHPYPQGREECRRRRQREAEGALVAA